MATVPQNLDYTDRDFDSLRLRLQALIRSVFPNWTDFNVANFGNILIDLYAHIGDVLTFYQDNQAGESRIATVTQRKNMIALCKLIGFTLKGATAAQATERFSIPLAIAHTVTLPAGTKILTEDITEPIQFQLLEDAVIEIGNTFVDAVVENSESHEDFFVSSGLPGQSFVLPNTPYLENSATFVASDGTYIQVENFLDSGPNDKHFVVVVDQNDSATIVVGDGVNGKIPSGSITVESKTGGGSEGEVEPNTIKKLQGSFTDSIGNPVVVTCTNPLKATGGTDRMSIGQAKIAAPATIRAGKRSVAREDFELHALEISGVGRALLTTSNEDIAVPENSGNLYLVPVGGGAPSTSLKNAVQAQFIGDDAPFPPTTTFRLTILDPAYKKVDVFAVVYFRPGVSDAVGSSKVRSALSNFFAVLVPAKDVNGAPNKDAGTPNPNIDFGLNLKDANGALIGLGLGRIFDAVSDVPQVLRVGGRATDFTLNGGHADVPIAAREFPQLGTITLVNGATGLEV